METHEHTRHMAPEELHDLERTLGKLDDVPDLSDWDREFVDDMCRRVIQYGARAIVTGKQWQQIERMKEKHL